MCLNNIEEIFLKSVIKAYMHFCVYLKYNSLNMSEQEMLNIKVIEKQETHFMPMHVFNKSKTLSYNDSKVKQHAKINTMCYFFFCVVVKPVFSNEDLIDVKDWDSDNGLEICD